MRPGSYVIDRDDPRAPPEEVWAALSPEERVHVLSQLPGEVPWELAPPEGDHHRIAKTQTLDALGAYFRRIKKRVYLSSELATYYPGKPRIAPDLLAVLDVEDHPRSRWVVSHEGKGLDVVIEVLVAGDAAKDLRRNVELYASLGIPEYFVFDHPAGRVVGHRLPDAGARRYVPILPQAGRVASTLLDLDVAVEDRRLRFYHGTAPLLVTAEVVDRLEAMCDDLVARREEEQRAREDAQREREELEQRLEDAERRHEDARARVAELERELERLRRDRA
jgi:Uma2 family endonuclease